MFRQGFDALWKLADPLPSVSDFEPLLASWERSTHPAQVRLRSYLDDLARRVHPLPAGGLALHLDVDVREAVRLTRHYDLENYLTPLVTRLDGRRFVHVSSHKRVGGGPSLQIGQAKVVPPPSRTEGWHQFSWAAGSGVQTRQWKERLRDALAKANPAPLPPGPVEVQLAWRCSPARNWVSLWKPTGDAMGPVLGSSDAQHPFNPADDRIVRLHFHLVVDASLGHQVHVAMWWRPAPVRFIQCTSAGEHVASDGVQ